MTIRDHLMAIHEKHGKLTPDLVVEEARPVEHPLHGSVFDRAPGEAAEAWYKHRAHELIQSVRISYTPAEEDEDTSIRAFLAVRGKDESYVYEPAAKVAVDPFLREMALRDMEREWKALRARYGHFREFSEMIQAAMTEEAA